MSSAKKISGLLILIFVVYSYGCTNPFAPKFDENSSDNNSILTDLKTVEGVFQNFQYAYTFKDTAIYGELISPDFIFTYRDYDAGFDVSWGRDEEMKTTYGLFNNAQRLNLIWNNVVISSQDSATANIVRSFNLTVTFNPTDVIRLDGRVNLLLVKNSSTEKWAIVRWVDESNF
ncbi:MAG: hypothetical protein IPM56_10360 [Ignavibacteriales bacterium]|nr:MAG: hypothetical protein IPM56_10360 [Ignavibacteriales bacterium]